MHEKRKRITNSARRSQIVVAEDAVCKFNPLRTIGKYFARIRVGGKLIRQSLKTNVLSVAKRKASYQTMEGQNVIIAHGKKVVEGEDKNVKSFAWG